MFLNISDRWRKSHKLNRLRTSLYATLKPSLAPRVLFIFGCQRSGTTLLRDFIGLDRRFRDIGEGDPPYFNQEQGERYLRLVDDPQVEAMVNAQKSPWVLLKPLHDSQRAAELLERFQGSRGIWIFRHYHSVVQSHLGYYLHHHLDYLQPLRQMDLSSWMLSGLGCQRISQIRKLVEIADESVPDLYAVFWFARNAFFFQNLKRCNLLLVSYEDLVASPHECLQAFSKHLSVELSTNALSVPRKQNTTKPSSLKLNPEIQDSCNVLLKQLRSVAGHLA